MKILFSVLNSKYIHSSLAPWCLFTACRESCQGDFSFSVFEGTINQGDEELFEAIMKENADVVTFSCYIWNLKKTLILCERIKNQRPETVIVLGGPEVAYNQREVLENNRFVDFISSGEGEGILPSFFHSLLKNEECNVPGISYIKEGIAHISNENAAGNESFPSPYCEEYFSSLKGRIAYIESSRGCPYNCAFCLSGRCGKVRFFPLERIKSEMLSLCRVGAKTIKFVDRTFNCHKKRAAEILLFINENYGGEIPSDVCFHFEIAADILDDRLLNIIETMPKGSVQFEAGIQSFNEKTLLEINRKTNINLVEENLKRLISFGNCHVHIDLIAGLPLENFESFVSGFNRGYFLGANMLQLGFLKILHGSPMGENPEKYPCKHRDEPPYEVISTPYISEEELMKLHKTENELERLYNSGRFRRTLNYVFQKSEVTPFELFYTFALFLEEKGEQGSIPLDRYVCLAHEFLSSLKGIDKSELRDRMICDRLASNNSGVIPESLKIADSNLKKARSIISEISPLKKGIPRSVAILYSEKKIVWCDYDKKDSVTGEYQLKFK